MRFSMASSCSMQIISITATQNAHGQFLFNSAKVQFALIFNECACVYVLHIQISIKELMYFICRVKRRTGVSVCIRSIKMNVFVCLFPFFRCCFKCQPSSHMISVESVSMHWTQTYTNTHKMDIVNLYMDNFHYADCTQVEFASANWKTVQLVVW